MKDQDKICAKHFRSTLGLIPKHGPQESAAVSFYEAIPCVTTPLCGLYAILPLYYDVASFFLTPYSIIVDHI